MRKLPILKSLHLFEAVSEFPSFSRAAERLNMTTGAVSYQMRLLEDWFGRRLFVRHSSGVRLTSDGEQLKRSCASAFTMLEKGCYELRRSDGGRSVVGGLFNHIFVARPVAPDRSVPPTVSGYRFCL
ncbi:LysR family transcriptional regulator [Bradyrhizobium elkanii]